MTLENFKKYCEYLKKNPTQEYLKNIKINIENDPERKKVFEEVFAEKEEPEEKVKKRRRF